MHFPRKHSELVKLFCLSPGFTPSGRSPTCLSPQTWWGYVLDPWTVKNTETTSCSDPTTAGHLSGEIGTNSPLTPSLPSFHHHSKQKAVSTRKFEIFISVRSQQKSVYSTMYSQAVTHPSTNMAQCCLTSVIRRELVFSTWYGRRQRKRPFLWVQYYIWQDLVGGRGEKSVGMGENISCPWTLVGSITIHTDIQWS